MTSLDFLKALLVLGCLISSMKRELNMQIPCRISLSVITAKMPFSSSLLISLCRESVKGVSCTRTDISAGGDCLVDIPVELIGMPMKFMWFFVAGFLFVGCF
jgi:hypothetical protein